MFPKAVIFFIELIKTILMMYLTLENILVPLVKCRYKMKIFKMSIKKQMNVKEVGWSSNYPSSSNHHHHHHKITHHHQITHQIYLTISEIVIIIFKKIQIPFIFLYLFFFIFADVIQNTTVDFIAQKRDIA